MSIVAIAGLTSVFTACGGQDEPESAEPTAIDEYGVSDVESDSAYDVEWGVSQEEQNSADDSASAASVLSCANVCSGVGVVACLPFGGWVGSAACGFASIPICNQACKHKTPLRIAEQRARHCLLSELPEGSSAKFIGYRDTEILFDVANVHTQDGHVHTGKAAVKKTYAGTDKIILSWRIGGNHVRPMSQTSCGLTTSASAASSPQSEPIWRYWNPSNLDHTYTLDRNDGGYAVYGYGFETSEGRMFRHMEQGSVAVYRYWNPNLGDHFFTTDWDEGANAAGWGWGFEGVSGYIFDAERPGTVPLYRYFSGTAWDHFYTKAYAPNGFCYGACYSYEGVLGYVYP